MAKQTINIGASPNDGTGTPLRTAFDYTNQNFTELYTATGPSGNNIVVPGSATITGDLTVDTNVLKVDTTNNRVGIGTASPALPFVVSNAGAQGFEINPNGSIVSGGIDILSYNRSTSVYKGVGFAAESYLFRVGTVSATDAMTLNSTGLGVGASPASYGGTYRTLAVNATDAGILDLMSNSVSQFRIFGNGSENRLGGITNVPLTFHTNNSEKMQISASGNVGIGVTPSAWSSGGYIQLPSSRAYAFAGSSGDYISNGYYEGAWKYTTTAAVSRYRQDSGSHLWYNAASGTAGANITFTQAMTLDASGNLLVGTTGVHLAAHSAFQNNASGQVTFRNTSTTAGRYFNIGMESGSSMIVFNDAGVGVYLGYGTTSWGSTSDEKVKDIIEPISNAVAKVGSLRSVIGKFKTDSEGTRRSFLIAQDVQSVLPEAVDTSNADLLAVRYTEVIPLLVAAIKELTAEVNALKKA